MKCQYCGEELSGGRFCTNCGKPVPETPAGFQTEQQIPEPTMRQIPTPVQQVPEPTEWIPAPTQQTPPQPVPPTQPTGQGAPGKKTLKPGVIAAIVLGVLLVVLAIVLTRGTSGSAADPEEQTRQLTQYAVGKAWLEDCGMEKSTLGDGYTTAHVQYYIHDFDNDGGLELVVTAFDWGRNAQCLLYDFVDGQVQLLASFGYEVTGADTRIRAMQLAAQKGFSGFAAYFTLVEEDEYPYLGVLQLEDNTLTEIDAVVETDECAAYMSSNGWELLSGTPIIIFDEALMNSVTPEMLTALTRLYDPQNTPDDNSMLKVVDGTVYAVEQSGLYRFADGEKQLLCKAPEDIKFSLVGGFFYHNGSFYILGIKNLADETQEYQVFRADVSAGTAELLFTLPDRATLIKVDEQYIYAEYAINDDNAFDEVTVYDHQGTEIETLAVPQTWATDGKLVLGLDHERNCSVITADGQYLMENLPVEDAKLVDGSVYYLTGDDTSMTLYRLTANGKDTVGTVPCTGADFRQRGGKWLVGAYNDDQRTYYDLDQLQKVYSDQEVMSQLTGASSISYIDFAQDAVTGEVYLLTAYAPHGNSGPIYRMEGDWFELLRNREEEIFYWMVYDDTVYFGRKDYSNGESYMQAPMIADCLSEEALSQ